MKNIFACLLLLTFAVGCTTDAVQSDQSILPLESGNEWTYYKETITRGFLTDRDTVTLRVVGPVEHNGAPSTLVLRESSFMRDSLFIERRGSEQIVFTGSDSLLISLDALDPSFSLLPIVTRTLEVRSRFERLSDTTLSINGSSKEVRRIAEHSKYIDSDGQEKLRLDFVHRLAPGVGYLSTEYIIDITQCQQCTLFSEFSTYRLLSYNVSGNLHIAE